MKMRQGVTFIALLTVALSCAAEVHAGQRSAAGTGFVTTGWANLRQGPGSGWALLANIPPATPVEVDFSSKTWSIGWCQVTYQGQTGSVHSSLLKSVGTIAVSAGRGGGHAKPVFLVQAERNYRRAQQAYEAQKRRLAQLLQEEARLSRKGMARTGQWVEPTALWRSKVVERQNLASLRQAAAQAPAGLGNAVYQARSISNARSSRAQAQSWSSWWRW
jgi:uncharacterized protein YraI